MNTTTEIGQIDLWQERYEELRRDLLAVELAIYHVAVGGDRLGLKPPG